MTARVHVWNEKWDEVLAEIEAGNKAPYAIHYQVIDGPSPMYPLFATVRQLARAIGEACPKVGPEKAAPLLKSFRAVGRKMAGSEPRGLIPLFLGISVRTIAQKGLIGLYPAGSPEAGEAEKTLDSDAACTKRMRADATKVIGENGTEHLEAAMRKQKISKDQLLP